MTLYKNSRIEAEMNEDAENEAIDKKLQEPAKNEEEESFKKRYGDLRRFQQQREEELKEQIKSLEVRIQKISAGEIRPPKSEAEIVEWEKEYPDFAQIMDARVERIVATQLKEHDSVVKEVKKDKALLALKKAVSRDNPDLDVDKLLTDAQFHEWLKNQSAITRKAIYNSLNVDDAADVIDRYVNKVLSKKTKKNDFDDGDAARHVRTRSSTPDVADKVDGEYLYSESQIQRMTKIDPKWWDTNGEKVMAAQRRGKLLMDVTGDAR